MATKEIEHNLPQGLFTLHPILTPPKIQKKFKKNKCYKKDIMQCGRYNTLKKICVFGP